MLLMPGAEESGKYVTSAFTKGQEKANRKPDRILIILRMPQMPLQFSTQSLILAPISCTAFLNSALASLSIFDKAVTRFFENLSERELELDGLQLRIATGWKTNLRCHQHVAVGITLLSA
jgi:hypothetical protein